uniref:Uncharacterized protein n=1 Tax=uncultured marine virus TaxID=186617 RepID=A0A0F7L3D1_9VIRU|nr:hypothetical protein [uncultured marine virus]
MYGAERILRSNAPDSAPPGFGRVLSPSPSPGTRLSSSPSMNSRASVSLPRTSRESSSFARSRAAELRSTISMRPTGLYAPGSVTCSASRSAKTASTCRVAASFHSS